MSEQKKSVVGELVGLGVTFVVTVGAGVWCASFLSAPANRALTPEPEPRATRAHGTNGDVARAG